MKQIAFFDFDGTITSKDTLLEFIKFSKGSAKFYWGFFIFSPILILYKLKIISNQSAKEQVLKYFFGGTSVTRFEADCIKFDETVLPTIIRSKAITEISRLKGLGCHIVLVSASPHFWIKSWANRIGAQLLATELEVKSDKITGKISGANCYGEEKVNRIKKVFDLKEYEKIYAFGDSDGDKAMLALAQEAHYKPFL